MILFSVGCSCILSRTRQLLWLIVAYQVTLRVRIGDWLRGRLLRLRWSRLLILTVFQTWLDWMKSSYSICLRERRLLRFAVQSRTTSHGREWHMRIARNSLSACSSNTRRSSSRTATRRNETPLQVSWADGACSNRILGTTLFQSTD